MEVCTFMSGEEGQRGQIHCGVPRLLTRVKLDRNRIRYPAPDPTSIFLSGGPMASCLPLGRNMTVKVTRAEARMPAEEQRSL